MSTLILLAFIILLLSLLFLGLSIAMILKKYTLRGTITSIFFLILSVKYLIFIYYEFVGIPVNLVLFLVADIVMLFSLLALMISR
ncbi:MAG: hypothetical protein M0Z77_09875 [Thermoplasmatales archaeon]|jgi:hypothetical protein|nr:hypothetical protein [Candidatus Thermoplasmatota archaeon]MCL6002655.1 hypothetical protein [Candidatus Thermoplasmatota archaeon]MDA8055934.1 hypothetical protein [Thermoplasmatales archaeon]